MAIRDFRIFVYNKYDDLTLIDDLSDGLVDGFYTTQLHGGLGIAQFRTIRFREAMWRHLRGAAPSSSHYAHVVVYEGLEWRWEGRIIDIALVGQRSEVSLAITAYGYYSSLRDEEIPYDIPYDITTTDVVIKDLLNQFCPSINPIQTGIDRVPGTISLILKGQRYTQEAITKTLAPLGDPDGNTYYLTIGKDRIVQFRERIVTDVHWETSLEDMTGWEIRQSVKQSRISVKAYVGEIDHDPVVVRDWPSSWPHRTKSITLPIDTDE